MSCLVRSATALAVLGHPAQARKRAEAAVVLARDLSHPHTLVYTLIFAATVGQLLGDPGATGDLAREAIGLASDMGFALWLPVARFLDGWAFTRRGRLSEGASCMESELAAAVAMGSEISRPYFLTLLAELHLRPGQAERGLSFIGDALALAHRTGNRWNEAEMYRIKGELLLRSGADAGPRAMYAEAEECLNQAISVARRQGARLFELRAATSLARHLVGLGRTVDARQMLTTAIEPFGPELDTADRQTAWALLESMS